MTHTCRAVLIRSQGMAPEDYPHAYLVTAPRFLRYSFNPASFWYLYSQDLQLKAMIIEVNNTFDERRIYFLKGEASSDDRPCLGGPSTEGNEEQGLPKPSMRLYTFKDKWAKDFHVSPFNSRKGSYSILACDPFAQRGKDTESIDNTITLNSSKGHPKLVARFFSTDGAKDPSNFTLWSKFCFIMGWCWVGLSTYPRIVREAAKLFFFRKLHVWYRPEPLKDSMGRLETERERIIEESFRQLLKEHLERSQGPVTLKYVASGSRCRREEVFSHDSSSWNRTSSDASSMKDRQPLSLTLKVLTPLFYSRLARAQSLHELFKTELLHSPEEDRSIWSEDIGGLLRLFEPDGERKSLNIAQLGPMDKMHWNLLRRLRTAYPQEPPRTAVSQSASSSGPVEATSAAKPTPSPPSLDPISHPLSPLDQHVLCKCTIHEARTYRRTVTSILIADYIFGGNAEVLDGVDSILRIVLTYWTIAALWDWTAALFSEELWVDYPRLAFKSGIIHAWWVVKEWLL